ncbi:MAG: nitroreductase family deazaflavin-dependent oxidoreductase [Mycobacteriales bacterium]|nr:nitroreductase family deazaflavin-dependent oxidoreductase [Frankia sp.]
MPLPEGWDSAELYYVTTTGRRSGKPHTVEIWCAAERGRLYLLAGDGERSDTVRNVRAGAAVTVRVGDDIREARAYVVTDPAEDAAARKAVVDKYQPGYGESLEQWGRTALPVVIEVAG